MASTKPPASAQWALRCIRVELKLRRGPTDCIAMALLAHRRSITTSSSRLLDATKSDRLMNPRSRARSISHARYKSSWNKSSWHRPGCTWVSNENDPKYTARDKECPACTEDSKLPYEVSQRELLWQRQVEQMRTFIEKDPYEALFGWSNRRVRALWPEKFMTEQPCWPWSEQVGFNRPKSETIPKRSVEVQGETAHKSQSIPRSTAPKDDFEKQQKSTPARDSPQVVHSSSSRGSSGHASSAYSSHQSASTITTLRSNSPRVEEWTWNESIEVKSPAAENAQTYTSSGQMVYDPISSRMVLKHQSDPEKLPTQSSEAIDIPVKTSKIPATATPDSSAKPILSRTNDENNKVDTDKENVSKVKKALEASWARQTKGDPRRHAFKEWQERSARSVMPTAEKAYFVNKLQEGSIPPGSFWQFLDKKHDKIEAPASSEPTAMPPPVQKATSSIERSRKDTRSYMLNNTKTLPLKHMRKPELGWYRSLLLQRWAARLAAKKEKSAADLLLEKEIETQKEAMLAAETKGHSPRNASQSQTIEPVSIRAAIPTEMIAGEGDICRNVGKFVDNGRWYKMRAVQSPESEQQVSDGKLVADVKDVYQEAYGEIDIHHRQRPSETARTPISSEANTLPLQSSTTSSDAANSETVATDKTSVPQGSFIIRTYEYDTTTSSILIGERACRYTESLPQHPDMPLGSALSILQSPAIFVERLSKDGQLKGRVIRVEKNLLTILVPVEKIGELREPVNASESVIASPIEPMPSTYDPELTSQPSDVASPTAFVNHDHPKPQAFSSRRVRKQEPVFSGPSSGQRHATETSGDGNNSSIPPGRTPSMKRLKAESWEREKHQRNKDKRFLRVFRRMLILGSVAAGFCYATGVVVEYFRNGPTGDADNERGRVDGRTEISRANFKRQMNKRRQDSKVEIPKDHKVEIDDNNSSRFGLLSELPFSGAEVPLLGLLGWSVWWLISD